jgi:ABC-type Co2+ transport system permease subunit
VEPLRIAPNARPVPGAHMHEVNSPGTVKAAWIISACTVGLGIVLYALSLTYYLDHNPRTWIPTTMLAVALFVANAVVYVLAHRTRVYTTGGGANVSVLPPLAGMNAVLLVLILMWAFHHPSFVQWITR